MQVIDAFEVRTLIVESLTLRIHSKPIHVEPEDFEWALPLLSSIPDAAPALQHHDRIL